MKLERICVFSGSNFGVQPAYTEAAKSVGKLLAKKKITLVYGGARIGLMGTVANAVLEAGGEAIGIIPQALVDKELAHENLTALHVVRNMHERKAMMADLSDAFIALPGGLGTYEELFEIIAWLQLNLHSKPLGILNTLNFYDHLFEFLKHAVTEGFMQPEHIGMVPVSADPEKLLELFQNFHPIHTNKWQ